MKIASAVRFAKALRKAGLHNREFHNNSAIARPIPDRAYGPLDAWHYDVICLACAHTGTCDEPEYTTELTGQQESDR